MAGWTEKWFFFLVISFLIFTVSGNYGPKWKAIFTGSVNSDGTVSTPSGLLNLPSITPIQPLG